MDEVEFKKWLEQWLGENLTYTNFMHLTDGELATMMTDAIKRADFKIEKHRRVHIVNTPEPGGQWSRVGDTDYG